MFTVLAVLLSYSLITFGGVLPNNWFFLTILWLIALAGSLILQACRIRHLKIPILISAVMALLLFQFTQAKLAVGLMAGVWAWASARTDNGSRTLRFFHFLLLIGLVEALLGLVQFFISPGWIFGYTNPFFRSTGTLINRNHFAGLLEMLIPVPLGLAYISVRARREGARAYIYVLAAAVMGLALIFSVSRMGIFSFLLTTLLIGLLLRLRDSQQRLATGLGLGLLVLVLGGAMWIGLDSITVRYAE